MKMTKILATAAVAAVVAFGFMACAAEEDDDDANAIKGSNNNYSINWSNTPETWKEGGMYRGYRSTYNNHRGGLCQISMDEVTYTSGNGTIGYIFDLESKPNRAAKEPRTLCIVGYNLARKAPYVSRFNNVTDIQADNFGTKLSENPAKETEYLGWTESSEKKSTTMELTKDSSNQYNLTVDVNGESREAGYVVKIYNGKIEKADLATKKPVYTVVIPTTDLYPNLDAKETKMPQKAAAVYVNVFEGKTMNAKWHYADTYSADEIAE